MFSVVQDDGDPAWYTMKERLPMLGGLYESTRTFRCRWKRVEGRADAEVYAGSGTHIKSEMRVLDSEFEGGEVEFQEVLVVSVSAIATPSPMFRGRFRGLFFLMHPP